MLNFFTLATGHNYEVGLYDVERSVLDDLQKNIVSPLDAAGTFIYRLPPGHMDDYTVEFLGSAQGAIGSIVHKKQQIMTFIIAMTEEELNRLWPYITDKRLNIEGKIRGDKRPDPPCVVSALQGHAGRELLVMPFFGDFIKCVGMAFYTYNP